MILCSFHGLARWLLETLGLGKVSLLLQKSVAKVTLSTGPKTAEFLSLKPHSLPPITILWREWQSLAPATTSSGLQIVFKVTGCKPKFQGRNYNEDSVLHVFVPARGVSKNSIGAGNSSPTHHWGVFEHVAGSFRSPGASHKGKPCQSQALDLWSC